MSDLIVITFFDLDAARVGVDLLQSTPALAEALRNAVIVVYGQNGRYRVDRLSNLKGDPAFFDKRVPVRPGTFPLLYSAVYELVNKLIAGRPRAGTSNDIEELLSDHLQPGHAVIVLLATGELSAELPAAIHALPFQIDFYSLPSELTETDYEFVMGGAIEGDINSGSREDSLRNTLEQAGDEGTDPLE
jgi:hypothetical protein